MYGTIPLYAVISQVEVAFCTRDRKATEILRLILIYNLYIIYNFDLPT